MEQPAATTGGVPLPAATAFPVVATAPAMVVVLGSYLLASTLQTRFRATAAP